MNIASRDSPTRFSNFSFFHHVNWNEEKKGRGVENRSLKSRSRSLFVDAGLSPRPRAVWALHSDESISERIF